MACVKCAEGRHPRRAPSALKLFGVGTALVLAAAAGWAQSAPTSGVLGVLGAPSPAPAGSVPANAPVISVSVDGSSVKSGQTVTVPPTPVADTSDAITVEISNTGGSTLKLDKYAPPELYGDGSMMYIIDYTTYSRTIDPGENTTISVTFFPYQTGTDEATLVIISNDPRTPQFEIKLSGKGLPMSEAVSASSQTYGASSP